MTTFKYDGPIPPETFEQRIDHDLACSVAAEPELVVPPYTGPVPPVTQDEKIWHDMARSQERRAALRAMLAKLKAEPDFTAIQNGDFYLVHPNSERAVERAINGAWELGFLQLESLQMRELFDQLRAEGFLVEIKC